MNFVIEKYDTALMDALAQLGKAEKLVRAKDAALLRKSQEFMTVTEKAVEEQDRVLAQKTAQKAKYFEKFGELKEKYRSSRERVKEIEQEKAALGEEKADLEEEKRVASLRHVKDVTRLKQSRSFEVTHERVRVQTAMIPKSNRRFNNIRNRR